MFEKPERSRFEGPWVADYQWQRATGTASRLILMLHGYRQTGPYLLEALRPAFSPELLKSCHLLAPNAPFPIPDTVKDPADRQRVGLGKRIGFAWYFRDSATGDFYIDPGIPSRFLATLIQTLGLADLPKTVIGFSQGGYVSPYVIAGLSRVDQFVCISSHIPSEAFAPDRPLRIDTIHGDQDEVVPLAEARASVDDCVRRGRPAKLHVLPGVGHRITPEVIRILAGLLS